MQSADSSILDAIPDSETIRDRLAQLARERRLLRDLLRIAVQREEAQRLAREHQSAAG